LGQAISNFATTNFYVVVATWSARGLMVEAAA